MIYEAEAPSNIALVKYMGKKKGDTANTPTNGSLSYTLNHLKTRVEAVAHDDSDAWEPLNLDGWTQVELSDKGKKRYLSHWTFLKEKLGIKGNFLLMSANNFPSDCGLASSASSFAALTELANKISAQQNSKDIDKMELAHLSRQGSGSSCRSLYTPWCKWEGDFIESIESKYSELLHQVIIVDEKIKKVSSSEAHWKVTESLLFDGRIERASKRLDLVQEALSEAKWKQLYEVCWAEFWDMHVLFETSNPPFHYMTGDSLNVLNFIREIWESQGDGPVVTMDAGPNIHVLYRPDQKNIYKMVESTIGQMFQVIGSVGDSA